MTQVLKNTRVFSTYYKCCIFPVQTIIADKFSLTIMLHFYCTFWACSRISVRFWELLNCLTGFCPQSDRGIGDGSLLFEQWITSIERKVFLKPPVCLFHCLPSCTSFGWADSKSLHSSLQHTELVLNFLLSKPCCKLNQNTFIRGMKINPTEAGFYHVDLSEACRLGYVGFKDVAVGHQSQMGICGESLLYTQILDSATNVTT